MHLTYWMYQGTAHYGVARITNSLRNVQSVFHAPLGDDYINTIFSMLERTPDLPRMQTSVVTGRDLAQGTLQLPERLRQIEATHKPDLIVVAASCSTVLLQEDLERVAQSSSIETDILVYDANPYRMQEIAASEGLLTVLVKKFARSHEPTPYPSVAILGPASLGFHARSDLIALRRMLDALGVKVQSVVPWGASLDDIRHLPAAWVTIAPYRELGRQSALYLEQEFGIPALCDVPMGVRPTLAWLHRLVDMLNEVGARIGGASLKMPPLTAFSLDGLSTPSSVPWFARTADMESFSSKTAFVFGDATHTVGTVKFLRDELGMEIVGAGTYVLPEADWVRAELDGYVPNELLATETFQDVAHQIEQYVPDLVCGTQMERHSSRKLDVPCMVISSPTHIENNLLGYYPMLGFAGADVMADRVYTSTKLGMEKHLIDMFGDAGLDYEEPAAEAVQPVVVSAPVEPEAVSSASALLHNGMPPTGPRSGGSPALRDRVLRGFLKPITWLVGVPMPTESLRATSGVVQEQRVVSPISVSTAPAAAPQGAADGQLVWDADAEAMLKKIPAFVRGKVRKNTETYAVEKGYQAITVDILREAKEAIGG